MHCSSGTVNACEYCNVVSGANLAVTSFVTHKGGSIFRCQQFWLCVVDAKLILVIGGSEFYVVGVDVLAGSDAGVGVTDDLIVLDDGLSGGDVLQCHFVTFGNFLGDCNIGQLFFCLYISQCNGDVIFVGQFDDVGVLISRFNKVNWRIVIAH